MIQRIFFAFVVTISFVTTGFTQGTIKGKITDENDKPVAYASIVLESNYNIGVYSNEDGTYELEIPTAKPYVLIVSFIGYEDSKIPFEVSFGETKVINVKLVPAGVQLDGVVVVAKANLTTDYALERMKLQSLKSIDFISAATISKTGDSDVTAAVSRVSGVSTHGGFITVRGIGDRYIKSTINGSRIPTLDPFTNNIKLDLFPTSLINNVILTKTASPDLPGDWSGAYISIETKSFPKQLNVNYSTSFTYNEQLYSEDFLTSNQSSTDKFGFDNGMRDYNHSNFSEANPRPNDFEEFSAIGLDSYFETLGINETTQWNESYTKLALVELGFLDKAKFNDSEAIAQAKSNYAVSDYKRQAYEKINSDAVESATSFQENWVPSYKKAPISHTQSFSVGDQISLRNRPLGYFASIRYYSSSKQDPHSITNRLTVDTKDQMFISSSSKQIASSEEYGWSSLFILAYMPHRNHDFSLLFMPNFIGVNKVKNSIDDGSSQTYTYTFNNNLFYEERQQLIYQYKSSHRFYQSKIQVNIDVSFTDGKSNAPDFRFLRYFADEDSVFKIVGAEQGIFRYYRRLNENILDSRLEFKIPLDQKFDNTRTIKIGGSYVENQRISDQLGYKVNVGKSTIIVENNDFSAFFADEEFNIYKDDFNRFYISKFYQLIDNPSNHIVGYSTIISGFAMIDYAVTSNFLCAGGVRLEQSDIFTDAKKYHELGLSSDDTRRQEPGGLMIKPGAINQLDLLPSINVIYKIKDDFVSPINLRVNYGKSIARPSIRELSDVSIFDYELQDYVIGNSDLKPVSIHNYDIRLEAAFKNGDNVSLSYFYKKLENHIELISSNRWYTWDNAEISTVNGIEFEGKKYILKGLELKTNISLVESETTYILKRLNIENDVETYIPTDTISRQMYGQAPYVINAILSYTLDTIDFNITLSYNIQGPRLVITSTNLAPDIYEHPRELFNIKISKKLGPYFTCSFKISDVFETPIRRTYRKDNEWFEDYDRYSYGRAYSVGLKYSFNK